MIWVPRGRGFWSSRDGRFDKLKVSRRNETYWVIFDWNLGERVKSFKEEGAEEWAQEQLKKRHPALTPERTPA